MNRLKGKVAVVTGASLGLGRASAQRTAEEGASGREPAHELAEAGWRFVQSINASTDVAGKVKAAVRTHLPQRAKHRA